MPRALEPLPHDDPIFTRGVSFVFRDDLPAEDEEPAVTDVAPDDDASQNDR